MKATAVRDFNASIGAYEYRCKEGDTIEGDAKTIGQLEAIGLVSTKLKRAKPRKAEEND